MGPVTIAKAPERVVCVGQFRDIDAAVGLGVVPLAAPDLSSFIPGGLSPWVKTALAGAAAPQLFDTTDSLPFEQIAAQRPDLILGADLSSMEDDYPNLSRIAPTISPATGYNKDPWQVTTTRIGAALGRPDKATELVAGAEARIASAKAANPGFAGRTFTFGPVQPDGTVATINNEADSSAAFFAQLGMQLAPQVRSLPPAGIPNRSTISAEQLNLLDADVLILTYTAPEARQRIEASELFTRIPAVQRGSYVALDLPAALALAFPSALSIGYGLDQVMPKLQSALAK
ncbi:MAG: hypothetical protein ABS81_15395 [Pseudonocardia sp. SCN 72-86]|nr:MAG: hypothetical protein ABS81_15395 [Pseudonocardia sp. SCN 72-86]